MKIPNPLPQFEDHKTLIIISGRQTSDLYVAHKGTLKKAKSIKIPTPVYSDREGFFARSGGGFRLGSGSVYESKEYATQKKFLGMMEDAIKDTARDEKDIRSVYIFAPAAHAALVEATLPASMRKFLKKTYLGNYVNLGPLEALEKISDKRVAKKKAAKRASAPSSAKKILKKSRQARRVTGK